MTTPIQVNVTVSNVKWKKQQFFYSGKFTYEQIDPAPGPGTSYVTPNGNMNFGAVPDGVEVVLNWASPKVEINGEEYDAEFLLPNSDSIRLAEGMGVKPMVPSSSGQIEVPPGNSKQNLKIIDKNDDGKVYTYNLIVLVHKDGGKYLIDDPIIENRGGPPRFFMQAEPATSADPGEPGGGAMPADPATPPDPAGKNSA